LAWNLDSHENRKLPVSQFGKPLASGEGAGFPQREFTFHISDKESSVVRRTFAVVDLLIERTTPADLSEPLLRRE
jgi:hypothetical protein